MNSSQAIHHENPTFAFLSGRLQQPSSVVQIALTLNIIINIFRRKKLNDDFMTAMIATTDIPVCDICSTHVSRVVDSNLTQCTLRSKLCPFLLFRLVISCLVGFSLIHLLVVSMERYLAVKHPFVHISVVRETNLLLASFTAWLFSLIFHLSFLFMNDTTTFTVINNAFTGSSIAFTVLCHLTFYRESLHHKKQSFSSNG